MPIYEYQCQACGQHTEVLQKVSDAPLTKCSECGKKSLVKLVSSPSFQLKGEGWYVTDFRDKKKKPEKDAKPADSEGDKTAKGTSEQKSAETPKADSTTTPKKKDKTETT